MKRLWSAFGILVLGAMVVLSPIPAEAAAPPPQAAQPQDAQPQAQEGGPPPVPEARSQEEFAAYQQFMQEQDPDEQIRLVEDFLLEYPNQS